VDEKKRGRASKTRDRQRLEVHLRNPSARARALIPHQNSLKRASCNALARPEIASRAIYIKGHLSGAQTHLNTFTKGGVSKLVLAFVKTLNF
jgi:hypothetical protein